MKWLVFHPSGEFSGEEEVKEREKEWMFEKERKRERYFRGMRIKFLKIHELRSHENVFQFVLI
jgi:hypothetical protein